MNDLTIIRVQNGGFIQPVSLGVLARSKVADCSRNITQSRHVIQNGLAGMHSGVNPRGYLAISPSLGQSNIINACQVAPTLLCIGPALTFMAFLKRCRQPRTESSKMSCHMDAAGSCGSASKSPTHVEALPAPQWHSYHHKSRQSDLQ